MPRALKPCSTPGCYELVPAGTGRCTACTRKAEQIRGTRTQRGYGIRHQRGFRRKVLARDPICTLCRTRPSHHADHWPLSRRELVARHLDPNDPAYGRGLCHSCHSTQTAAEQPGGWNA